MLQACTKHGCCVVCPCEHVPLLCARLGTHTHLGLLQLSDEPMRLPLPHSYDTARLPGCMACTAHTRAHTHTHTYDTAMLPG